MPKLTQDVADKAQAIGGAFNRDVMAVKQNQDLTPDARVRHLATAYQRAKSEMDNLAESWRGANQATETRLDRDLFGSMNAAGADAISFRDAADRADQLESAQDAARLLQQAERTGDGVLAQAVAQRAYEMRGGVLGMGGADWVEVVETYAATRPEVASRIQQFDDARSNDLNDNLSAAFTFALAKPTELDRLSDWHIAEMASTEQSA